MRRKKLKNCTGLEKFLRENSIKKISNSLELLNQYNFETDAFLISDFNDMLPFLLTYKNFSKNEVNLVEKLKENFNEIFKFDKKLSERQIEDEISYMCYYIGI